MKVDVNQAREICEVVRKNFPYESPWVQRNIQYKRVIASKDPSKMKDVVDLQRKMENKTKDIGFLRECYMLFQNSPFDYFRELLHGVHTFKVQNCGEIARITYLVSRMNGINNSDLDLGLLTVQKHKEETKGFFSPLDKFAELIEEFENGNGFKLLDHVVAQVKAKKDIIIDPLLNECDTKSEIEKIYKTKYGDVLKVSAENDIKIVNGSCGYSSLPKLNDDEVKEFIKLYPELVIEKTPKRKGFGGKNFFIFK